MNQAVQKSYYTPHQEYFLDICRLAFREGTSDIHIEASAFGYSIRFRVDGVLKEAAKIEWPRGRQFFADNRVLMGFNSFILGAPQDCRFSHPNEKVDFRASIMPMKYGEKAVLRLLERGKEFSLDKYPLYDDAKMLLSRAILKKQGLIIISGPTGSGKTTLLYSAIGSLNRKILNISTIEDPIEYELAGLNQSEVNIEKGMSFQTGLRALMRKIPA